MTGLTSVVPGGFIAKQLEILRELIPSASKIALLVNPSNPMHRLALDNEMSRAARNFGLALPTVEATKAEELDVAFASAVDQRADAMIVFGDYLTIFEAPRVIALAAKHHLPAIYLLRQFAKGGLVVYGPDIADLFRRAGRYVDKILKGTKPSDLPVEQPTKFELVINMKTAKALGLTVPPSLLARADEVIECRCCLLRRMSPVVAHRDILHRRAIAVANKAKRKSRGGGLPQRPTLLTLIGSVAVRC